MTSSPAMQIGLVGTGVIGASWAALFLASGHRVRAFDPGPQSSENTRAYIDRAWAAAGSARCCCRWRKPGHISFVSSPEEAVEGAAFIQESVPERLPLKIETFQRIEPHLGDDAIVATSASGLLIKDMQDG